MISTPLAYTGCYLWLDASDTTTLSSLSADVVAGVTNTLASPASPLIGGWRDKATNKVFGSTTTPTITRPTWIPTLSTIRFNGSSSSLTSFFNQVNSPQTSFIVCKPASYTVGATYPRILTQAALGTNDTASNQHSPFVIAGSGSVASAYNGSLIGSVSSSGLDLYTCSRSLANNGTYNYRSGVPATSAASAVVYTIACTRLGAGIASGTTGAFNAGSYFTGDIAEVIIYNRELSLIEKIDVEYYLASKWSPVLGPIPRTIGAKQNGDFFNETTWLTEGYASPFNLPISADNVYANGQTITINSDVYVNFLYNGAFSTSLYTPISTTGGGFIVIDTPTPTTIRCNFELRGGNSTNTYCVVNYLSSSVLTISAGSVTGTAGYALEHRSSSNCNIIGNIAGGPSTPVWNTGYGNIYVLGNVTGGGAGRGISNFALGNVYVDGNVTGGSGAQAHGIINQDSGSVFVMNPTKTITGGTALSSCGIWNDGGGFVYANSNFNGKWTSAVFSTHAVNNNSFGTLFLSGNFIGANDIYAINNVQGNLFAYGDFLSGAVVSTSSIDAVNQFQGNFITNNINVFPVYCWRYLIKPTPYKSSISFTNSVIVNEFLYSNTLDNAVWTKTNTAVVKSVALNNNQIRETAINGNHICHQTFAVKSLARPIVFTVNIQKPLSTLTVNRQYIKLFCTNVISTASSGFSVLYDLTNGIMISSTVTGGGFIGLSGMSLLPNGNGYTCYIGGIVASGSSSTGGNILAGVSLCVDDFTAVTNGHFQSYLGNATFGVSASDASVGFLPSILWPYTAEKYKNYADTKQYKETTNFPAYGTGYIPSTSFYAPESYVLSYLPPASSVAAGTNYAGVAELSGKLVAISDQLSGTMIIPDPKSVAFRTPVGLTEGIALLNRDSIDRAWRTPVADLNQPDSLGAKLKDIIITSDARNNVLKVILGTDLASLTS